MVTKKNFHKPTLLLADDHSIVIDGLMKLLQPEFEVIGTVGDGWALLETAKRLKPDAIVADISMPLLNGIDAVRQLRKLRIRSKVVFLSMHMDVEIATEALLAGALGYVLKHSAFEALTGAIRDAIEGRIFVSPRISKDVKTNLLEHSHRRDTLAGNLTQREREVLQLIAEGHTIKGIAVIVKTSGRTAVFHKTNLMDKLGVRTTADLTQQAIKRGLISFQSVASDRVIGESG